MPISVPSPAKVTRAPEAILPTSFQVQLVKVVSAMKTRPSVVDATRFLPLASMSTENQSPLLIAARVLSVKARLLMRVAEPSPSLMSANCMPVAVVLRSVGNASL